MTQRQDSVFTNRVENEPVAGTTQSRLLNIRKRLRRDEKRDRLQDLAIIMMNIMEMSDAKEQLLEEGIV